MSEVKIPLPHEDWHRHLFVCDCHDSGCYLEIEWWDDEDFPPYLQLDNCFWAPTIHERIKASIKILFGKKHYTRCGVVLDKPTANRLLEVVKESQNGSSVGT